MFLSQSAHETTGCSHLLESLSSITCVMYAPISTSNPFLTQTNDCRSMEPWNFFFLFSSFFFFFFLSREKERERERDLTARDCGVCSVSEHGIERTIYIGPSIDSTPTPVTFAPFRSASLSLSLSLSHSLSHSDKTH